MKLTVYTNNGLSQRIVNNSANANHVYNVKNVNTAEVEITKPEIASRTNAYLQPEIEVSSNEQIYGDL